MKPKQAQRVKYSATAIIIILITGLLASKLPDTGLGKALKFTLPLLIGIIFAAKIYFEELKHVKQRLNNLE